MSCDSEYSFQNQNNEICQDTWPVDVCKEIKELELCPLESISTNCSQTCGTCGNNGKLDCQDILPSNACEKLKSKCTTDIIFNYCKKSCTKCDNEFCEDKFKTETCEKLKENLSCDKAGMIKNCMKTCGKCLESCKDIWKKNICEKKKKKNQCELEDVATNCIKTCNKCKKPGTSPPIIQSTCTKITVSKIPNLYFL